MTEHALFFGARGGELFGWLHLPASGTVRRVGLVLCAPLGREETCAHRSLRQVARGAAQAGVAALRFDYAGCGDSAGDALEPSQLDPWLASVHEAVQTLKQRAGVERVVLLGARAGALLAAQVAAMRDDVDALVVWAGVASGRALLREWKAMALASGSLQVIEGGIEAGGYPLGRGTCEALQSCSALDLARPPARKVLFVERDDLPGNERWIARLRDQGIAPEVVSLPGFADMLAQTHHSKVPLAVVEHTLAWLRNHAGPDEAATTMPPGAWTSQVELDGGILEEPITLRDDDGTALFGLLTQPAPGRRASGTAILLLSAGANRHVGPSRLYVPLARRWGALGHRVLRVDLSGLGDSDPRPGQREHQVYAPMAERDVNCAIAWLKRGEGITHRYAVGVCAGAFHAFKAAVRGAPLDGVVPINALTFFWKPGMSLDVELPEHIVALHAQRYRRAMFSAERWRRLFKGEVDLRHLAAVLTRRVGSALRSRLRQAARSLHIPVRDDLARELRSARRHGVALQFVFSEHDPGLTLLRQQGGAVLDDLQRSGALAIEVLAGADHNLTTVAARAKVLSLLERMFAGGTMTMATQAARDDAPLAPLEGAAQGFEQ
jgi:predicted alpha/beta hydrolase